MGFMSLYSVVMGLADSRFVQLTLPLIAAAVAWFFNERRKLAWEEYTRKEENYKNLLRASRGFHADAQNAEKKSAFLDEVNLCWLYCPDAVIRALYAFLGTVKAGASSTEEQRNVAFGQVVAAIRYDLLTRKLTKRTELRAADHKLFKST